MWLFATYFAKSITPLPKNKNKSFKKIKIKTFLYEMKIPKIDPSCQKRIRSPCESGLPDFSWYNILKWEKTYQTIKKYPKWPQNCMQLGRKRDQMAIKYINIFHCRILQN
jgi:hypothetical protein